MAEEGNLSEETLQTMLSFVVNADKFRSVGVETETLKEPKDHTCKTTLERNESYQSVRVHRKETKTLARLLRLDDPTVVIQIASFSFKVNMEILEVYSEYMRQQQSAKIICLPEDQVTATAFVAIYEWMLLEKPTLPRKGAIELYKAATFLQMPEFLEQFWRCLSNPIINEDKAFLFYLEALAFEAPVIRQTMLSRISRFFLPIVACEEFLHLPLKDLSMLLKSNAVGVNSEIEIFFACVRYFDFNWEERRPHIMEVMQCVRFDFLPTEFILELLNQDVNIDIPEVIRMVDHPQLLEILRDLMHYHCLSAFQGPNLVAVKQSEQRCWLFDIDCEYHCRENPRKNNPEYVRYSMFCEYLIFLCHAGTKHWESFEKISYFGKLIEDLAVKCLTFD